MGAGQEVKNVFGDVYISISKKHIFSISKNDISKVFVDVSECFEMLAFQN